MTQTASFAGMSEFLVYNVKCFARLDYAIMGIIYS
ncbi:hypothetical protein Dtox_1049 [Desulfofarcimen acetoxidans DSM 771]|uniref:Uncharacterized protein n=1 Tax=Desulfofarcimen acetoxidans (strain ATCC 49208 / DSM 771 / KCTC 5769 / VKM B-1644 / 5575) TaxID=485916 RepID=C8W467_DESAS|nr:hypothetical protein Dtox_1049 [Desulfofarcimen acetoxidans DSM 771]